uniref:RNA-guided endonuclease InsQ/TnpB family protein n=1 Tax=Succinimonas sp. TaxID=1936151 RepID=UPI003866F8C1
MILSTCFYIDNTGWFKEQFELSRCLFNQARYFFRDYYDKNKSIVNQTDLETVLRTQDTNLNYYRKLCKAKLAQTIVINLYKNYSSFFCAIKEFKVHPEKFNGEPKAPKYKENPNMLYFDYQSAKIKGQFIVLNKDVKIHIPYNIFEKYKDNLKNFKTINFIPKFNKIKVCISYETEELNSDLAQNQYLGIDLGLNNLCSCVSEFGCFIINGKPVKSINQYYNKEVSKLKSERPLTGDKQDFNYNKFNIFKLGFKRNLKIEDYLHNASRSIVNFCVEHKIGTVVIGRNKQWKDSIALGKQTNQNFVSVPFFKFMSMLRYKCKMAGINFAEQEESYTSKCDSLAFESVEKHEEYKGKRIFRGLFKSS